MPAIIALGTIWLGFVAFRRGQFWIGACLVGIALLRFAAVFSRARTIKPEVQLNLVNPPFVSRYPGLPLHLQTQLRRIIPSRDGDLCYYPCKVNLHDGTTLDCVYLVSEAPWMKCWGLSPETGKAEIPVPEIASISESPSRLPPEFANELYKAGESGMGYTVFTILFADGSRQAYVGGGAVDFIEYPEGKGPGDIVAVHPHEGRNDKSRKNTLDYRWCIFSEESS